jgi:hypothetical protein
VRNTLKVQIHLSTDVGLDFNWALISFYWGYTEFAEIEIYRENNEWKSSMLEYGFLEVEARELPPNGIDLIFRKIDQRTDCPKEVRDALKDACILHLV